MPEVLSRLDTLQYKDHALPSVLRLPPEIMSKIFLLSLPPSQGPFPHGRHTQLRFLGVCKYWRNAAHSTPRLWTSLVVPWYGDLDIVLKVAKWWFSFAGLKHRLRLTIEYTHGPKTRPIVYKSRTQLSQTPFEPPKFWSRIRYLALVADNKDMVAELLRFLNKSLTDIAQLNLHYTPDSSSGLTFYTRFGFLKLRKLVIGNYSTGGNGSPYDMTFLKELPWKWLTVLNMLEMPISRSRWRRLFEQFSETLRKGEFLIGNGSTPLDIRTRPRTMSVIHTLTILHEHGGDYMLLRDLTMPQLKTLVLGSLSALSQWDSEALNNMRLEQLVRLTVVSVDVTEHDLFMFLFMTPSVTELTLDIPIDYKSFLRQLKDVELRILLPRLEHLTMYQWETKLDRVRSQLDPETELAFDMDALIQVIEARWVQKSQNATSLRVIKIVSSKAICCQNKYHNTVMQRAISEGCKVVTEEGKRGHNFDIDYERHL